MPLDLCCHFNSILSYSNANEVSFNSNLAEQRAEERAKKSVGIIE